MSFEFHELLDVLTNMFDTLTPNMGYEAEMYRRHLIAIFKLANAPARPTQTAISAGVELATSRA